MNKAWLAAALSIVLILLFSFIVFMPDSGDLNPVKEVKVTVLSGSVDVENADSSQQESLKVGESVTITEENHLQRDGEIIPSPSPTPVNDYTQSMLQTSTLTVTVLDTAKQAVSSASIEIETELGKQQYSLDEQGTIAVPNLLHRDATVHFHHSDFFPVQPASVLLMNEHHELTLRVPRKGSIRAKVVGNGFEPVANAQTELMPDETIPDIAEADLELKPSNDEGGVEYSPVATGGYILLVTAPPYLPHRESIDATVNPDLKTIQLSEKSTLTVHVEDEDAEPVFAAKVTLKSMESGGGITLIQETSQVTGDTVFQDISPGKYVVDAVHDWYLDDGSGSQEFEITHDKQNVTLTLTHRDYSITGTVYDQVSGSPVEGAVVVAFSEEKIKQSDISDPLYNYMKKQFDVQPNASYTTSHDGKFRLTHLRGGTYTLGIQPRKDFIYVPFTKDWQFGGEEYNPVVLLNDQEQVDGADINLLRAWKITGKVMLEDGRVLPDAQVRVLAQYKTGQNYVYVHTYGYGSEHLQHKVEVDEDGEYLVEGNSYVLGKDFKLTLNASHHLYRDAYDGTGLHVEVNPGETITGVDLIFPAKVEINGLVKNEEGKALEGIVKISEVMGTTTAYEYADESGYYNAAFEPGDYIITAEEEGYISEIVQETLDLSEGNKKTINFTLKKGDDSFEGVLTDDESIPLPKRRVILSFNSSLFMGWDETITDDNGLFRLTPRAIPDEDIVFKLRCEATENYEEAVYETAQRGEKNIQLIAKKFNDYGSISGFVVDQTNQPITQFDIKLVPTNIRSYSVDYNRIYQWQPVTHPSGAFSIEKIPVVDGPFLVSARAHNAAPGFSDPVTVHKDLPVSNVTVHVKEKTFTVQGIIHSNSVPYSKARVLFIPKNPVRFDSFDSQENGFSQLNLSFPNMVTLDDGVFVLQGVPVQGGQLMVRPRWDDQDHQITMIKVSPAQPQEMVDIGVIEIQDSLE